MCGNPVKNNITNYIITITKHLINIIKQTNGVGVVSNDVRVVLEYVQVGENQPDVDLREQLVSVVDHPEDVLFDRLFVLVELVPLFVEE